MMRRMAAGAVLLCLAVAGCDDDDQILLPADEPAPPVGVSASYYARVVTVSWELSPLWNEEPFRVYSKRSTDTQWFMIAEVSSCVDGVCRYHDYNIVPQVTYQYQVAAVDPGSGLEASSAVVDVFVPDPTAPPVPSALAVVALDDANYVRWGNGARDATDFSFYRVYLDAGDSDFFLGETDSEGFLDLVAVNGQSYTYFVTSVDDQGHESDVSASASGIPRPDYHAEWLYDYADQPATSGFRFQNDGETYPVVDGDAVDRHFRLEVDLTGWWLVPNSALASVHPTAFATTALKCGVAADAACTDVSAAPTSGYMQTDIGLEAQTSYVLRVTGDDGQPHYGVIRVELLGVDQDGNDIMIFDWAYQLQANNPALTARVDDDAVASLR